MQFLENVQLKWLHTFGTQNIARYLVKVETFQELQHFLGSEWRQYPERMILGGGSNVLFTGDYQGLILMPQLKGIELLEETGTDVLIKVMCGEVWDEVVNYTVEKGWGGLENLSLIPGNVGACPLQNIGAYGVEVKEVIEHVECISLGSFQPVIFRNHECEFGYRSSIFKNREKGKYLITAVVFRLSKHPVIKTGYADVARELEKFSSHDIKAMRKAISAIRQRKLPDPQVLGNAGSFFKNPEISTSLYNSLKVNHPEMPGYVISDTRIKIPAAWLIEHTGFKGVREGDTGTSPNQPLVIVNYGQATGREVVTFAEKIQAAVKERFGIELEMEVNII